MTRAFASVFPPGAKGVMILTGLCGQTWDCPGSAEPRTASTATSVANALRDPIPGKQPEFLRWLATNASPLLDGGNLRSFRPQSDIGGNQRGEFFRAVNQRVDAAALSAFGDLGLIHGPR